MKPDRQLRLPGTEASASFHQSSTSSLHRQGEDVRSVSPSLACGLRDWKSVLLCPELGLVERRGIVTHCPLFATFPPLALLCGTKNDPFLRADSKPCVFMLHVWKLTQPLGNLWR